MNARNFKSLSNLKKEAKYFAQAAVEGAMDTDLMKYGAGPLALIGGSAMAFAAGDLESNLKKVMQKLFKWIIGISTALAVLLIAWNILKYMAATDPQSAMMAKKNAIRVAIAWVLLNSMNGIIGLMTTLTENETGVDNGIWTK